MSSQPSRGTGPQYGTRTATATAGARGSSPPRARLRHSIRQQPPTTSTRVRWRSHTRISPTRGNAPPFSFPPEFGPHRARTAKVRYGALARAGSGPSPRTNRTARFGGIRGRTATATAPRPHRTARPHDSTNEWSPNSECGKLGVATGDGCSRQLPIPDTVVCPPSPSHRTATHSAATHFAATHFAATHLAATHFAATHSTPLELARQLPR
ncbi:hypothetical protein SAMN05216388_100948 [Halorientalis persicus]|uniref:Uncharacterized protein n=1 Tax=Halorientalis persicus TaxID=1367881 RepID=A0A1H8MLY8_9EURY|nr:hypothetical protein SAMN05216388_100948 [Halorientalis persicus]